MKAQIVWFQLAEEVFLGLPTRDREEILAKLSLVHHFPHMFQTMARGRFRRHRRFVVGEWVVYYRVVGNTVYVRGIWPARIP